MKTERWLFCAGKTRLKVEVESVDYVTTNKMVNPPTFKHFPVARGNNPFIRYFNSLTRRFSPEVEEDMGTDQKGQSKVEGRQGQADWRSGTETSVRSTA